jgi:hypothetical protein
MASQKWGSYAFLIAIAIAIILGVVGAAMPGVVTPVINTWLTLLLVILGVIVGFLNIKDKSITDFLVATLAVGMVGSTAGGLVQLNNIITPLGTIFQFVVLNVAIVAAAAAIVVALKQIYSLAKEQV